MNQYTLWLPWHFVLRSSTLPPTAWTVFGSLLGPVCYDKMNHSLFTIYVPFMCYFHISSNHLSKVIQKQVYNCNINYPPWNYRSQDYTNFLTFFIRWWKLSSMLCISRTEGSYDTALFIFYSTISYYKFYPRNLEKPWLLCPANLLSDFLKAMEIKTWKDNKIFI